MPRWIRVASTTELGPDQGKVVQAEGMELALFNVGGKFHCLNNTCTHQGGPLGEGSIDQGVVTCPWHGYDFEISSGACRTDPGIPVQSHPTKLEGSDVYVELP